MEIAQIKAALDAIKNLNPTERFDAWVLIVWSLPISAVLISFKDDQIKLVSLIIYVFVFALVLWYANSRKNQTKSIKNYKIECLSLESQLNEIRDRESELLSDKNSELLSIREDLRGLGKEINHIQDKNPGPNQAFDDIQYQLKVIIAAVEAKVESQEGRLGNIKASNKMKAIKHSAHSDMAEYVKAHESLSPAKQEK